MTFADHALTGAHLLLIAFNLLGWMVRRWRALHFALVNLTAFSWVGLGYFWGWGYCPLTDLQWRIREKLGTIPAQSSFVAWFVQDVLGAPVSEKAVDVLTGVVFLLVWCLSWVVYGLPRLSSWWRANW